MTNKLRAEDFLEISDKIKEIQRRANTPCARHHLPRPVHDPLLVGGFLKG